CTRSVFHYLHFKVTAVRRPRPKLFPYTTLCRSDVTDAAATAAALGRAIDEHGVPDILVNNAGLQRRAPIQEFDAADWDAVIASKDRKSTRLNSSHVKTSYAVFCLHKRNRLPVSK